MLLVDHVFNSSLVSGPETLVMPNLVGFSHKCTMVLLQETRVSEGATKVSTFAKELGFPVVEVPVRGRLDMRAVWELQQRWREHSPDIIHAHGPKASLHSLLALKFSGSRRKTRLITTHHGVRANDLQRKLRFFETVYEKLVIPYCDLCLTVCTSDRELLIARGISPDRLAIHLNGVDREWISFDQRDSLQEAVRRKWKSVARGLNPSIPLVGIIGRLAVEKRHELLMKVLAKLHVTHPNLNYQLLCFGSGPLEAELKALTESLGLQNHLFWMGYRPGVDQEIVGLDLVVSLSRAEGLPINLIEAGWSGTAVLATGVDGVNDLIESGKSGILLSPDPTEEDVSQALGRLLSEPALRRELSGQLQKRVQEHFSKTAWVSRLKEIYEE